MCHHELFECTYAVLYLQEKRQSPSDIHLGFSILSTAGKVLALRIHLNTLSRVSSQIVSMAFV